jgi:nucleoside-diphosphate-sugar epimerase
MYAATKAAAERIARAAQSGNPESGGPAFPLTIVYPSAVQGPYDPTFSIGPQLVAAALISGKVLVTEGGLPSTDVRDLAALIERIFAGETTAPRLMAPSFFVPHEAYHALLEKLSGRTLEAQRSPGWLLRILGRLGDVAARLGRNVQLTHEAAEVLTRSVPVDDQETRALLGRPAISVEQSFSDLITWMLDAGHLAREHAPKSAQPPASSAT